MSTGDKTERIIARLIEVSEENPDLAEYYRFYQSIVRLQGEALTNVAATLELVDAEALQNRMAQGLLVLSFAQLPIDAERFSKLAIDLAQLLSDQEPSLQGQGLPPTAEGWIVLAQERFEEGQSTGAGGPGEEETLTLAQMAANLALRPYLGWAAHQALPQVDLKLWKRPFCPICGGGPDFAVLEEDAGARYLICSRCDCEWPYRRLGCPFCETSQFDKIQYYPSEDGAYRLYVCNSCQRYLKTVDLRKTRHAILPAAERIVTVSMDIAAQQEGYS